MSFSDFREVTFGGQEYDGDFHFNMFYGLRSVECSRKPASSAPMSRQQVGATGCATRRASWGEA